VQGHSRRTPSPWKEWSWKSLQDNHTSTQKGSNSIKLRLEMRNRQFEWSRWPRLVSHRLPHCVITCFCDWQSSSDDNAERRTQSLRQHHKAISYYRPAKLSNCIILPVKTCYRSHLMIHPTNASFVKRGRTPGFHVLPPGDGRSILRFKVGLARQALTNALSKRGCALESLFAHPRMRARDWTAG